MTDTRQLHAEIVTGLHHAIRRAWRELTPNWRMLEADTVLAAATAAITRDRPGMTDAQVLRALEASGVLDRTGDQYAVRVPPLPDPLPPAPRTRQ